MFAADPPFPECCATCPHRNSFKASCTHELRQAVVQEVDEAEPCPVYQDEKTDAMRELADSL
ncbi:hypothetical protein [Halobellus sp. GM3]|uniref:hypothetical protein n=1 Tax=Halobellus sp. GM3 TaxID=3458410 RepID=UPI00403DB750